MNSGRNIKNYILPLSKWEWNIYSIPIAIVIILISNGFFMGNNGLNGDFGLDYCNYGDLNSITNKMNSVEVLIEETESVKLHSSSFFACELGYVNGAVDLGWIINIDDLGEFYGDVWWQVMILNHDNYRDFVKDVKILLTCRTEFVRGQPYENNNWFAELRIHILLCAPLRGKARNSFG